MNLADAVYNTVHDAPGGAQSIAPRIGLSAQVLSNKVNPNHHYNVLSLKEASKIMAVTGDYRILESLCQEHGFMLVRIPHEPIGDFDLLQIITAIWKEVADVGATTGHILSDVRVRKADVAVLSEEVFKAAGALKEAMEALQE